MGAAGEKDVALILAAANPIDHVVDYQGLPGFLSMHIVQMFAVAVLLIVTMMAAARAIETGPESEGNDRYLTRGRFSQVIEFMVLALRDAVIKPQLGSDTNKFLPYLLTLFFFILYINVIGLVPLLDLQHLFGLKSTWLGGTPTGNIGVTAGLATIAFFVIHIAALRKIGFGEWCRHFTGGAPWYIWPIMIPVEILGMFIKPGALAIRLFANMTAGHTLLATILMFTGLGLTGLGLAGGLPVTIVSILAAVPLMFLELFVAFLQAFIFMFLTVVFLAQFLHHEHDDHAMAEAYHDGYSAETDPAAPVTA
jgi:F-type H+-transporting ATPase subunit a